MSSLVSIAHTCFELGDGELITEGKRAAARYIRLATISTMPQLRTA